MKEVITGSLGYDYIMNFSGRFADRIMPDKIHKISLSFLAEKLTKQYGGTAVNIAYTLRLLGEHPIIVTSAGNDFLELKQFLQKHDVDTSGIQEFQDEPCSSYHVVTDVDHNQIGSYYVGSSKHNKELSVGNAELVVIGPTDPAAMKKYIDECIDKNIRYFYDPAFQIGSFTPEELKKGITHAEILIGNDYEIGLIEEKLGISHEELLVLGPKIVITTLGAKGSIIETRNEAIHIKPAIPKNTSDPTGAGDAYRGGFLAGYMRGLDLVTCGQMGSVAAVYTVEKYGTVTHHYTKAEFAKRYEENYKMKLVF